MSASQVGSLRKRKDAGQLSHLKIGVAWYGMRHPPKRIVVAWPTTTPGSTADAPPVVRTVAGTSRDASGGGR